MFKKYACKSVNSNNKNHDAYSQLRTISTELSEKMSRRKQNNYRHLYDKLNDPNSSTKSYWSRRKTLCNSLQDKANHFSVFFAFQCIAIANDSTLPVVATPATNDSLLSISFNKQDIIKRFLKVHQCRHESLTLPLPSHKNIMPNFLHYKTLLFEIYAPLFMKCLFAKHTETIEYLENQPTF